MKLVLHDKKQVVTIFENVENLRIKGQDLTWTGGALGGLGESISYILVPNEVEVNREDPVTEELLAHDTINDGNQVPSYDEIKAENKLLKARVDSTEGAMINIIDMILEQNPLALESLMKK